MTGHADLGRRVAAIAADHRSGASTLAERTVGVLEDALVVGPDAVRFAVRRLCAAQPAMASIWNAAALALRPDGGTSLRRLGTQIVRAPRALSKVLGGVLSVEQRSGTTLSFATVSASSAVQRCLASLARDRSVRVICAEGRPMYEGRRLASALVQQKVLVTLCTDAALGVLVRDADPLPDALLVGADAITPAWFLNKCGTHAAASAAALVGVPVYVVAGRAAFVSPMVAPRLRTGGGPPDEVWDDPPTGVEVVNPYFERIPTDLVSAFVTDAGPVGPGSVGDVCDTCLDPDTSRRLLRVVG